MAEDPIDAFDQLADDIRRTQDELEAADALRRRKAEKPTKPTGPAAAGVEPDPPE